MSKYDKKNNIKKLAVVGLFALVAAGSYVYSNAGTSTVQATSNGSRKCTAQELNDAGSYVEVNNGKINFVFKNNKDCWTEIAGAVYLKKTSEVPGLKGQVLKDSKKSTITKGTPSNKTVVTLTLDAPKAYNGKVCLYQADLVTGHYLLPEFTNDEAYYHKNNRYIDSIHKGEVNCLSQETPKKLEVSNICYRSETSHQIKIKNNNKYTVNVYFDVLGTAQKGTKSVAANTEHTFLVTGNTGTKVKLSYSIDKEYTHELTLDGSTCKPTPTTTMTPVATATPTVSPTATPTTTVTTTVTVTPTSEVKGITELPKASKSSNNGIFVITSLITLTALSLAIAYRVRTLKTK